MICSIHQPQSFPWLGFFAKIYQSDIFILLDNVQFKKNEFQNRNKIKINGEGKWLTVPVKYHFGQLINEIEINNIAKWKNKHLKTLQNFYSKTPFFNIYYSEIENIYSHDYEYLCDFNISFITWALDKLDISTQILVASKLIDTKKLVQLTATEKLISLIKQVDCNQYLSGSGGKSYLDEKSMNIADIEVLYQTYNHPIYNQTDKEFVPYLSVLDLLFNEGPNSIEIIKKGIE